MKQRPANLWLVVALGVFVVGFCFYKLATVGGKTSSTDLPARAFVSQGAPTMISNEYLTKQRIPLGSYVAASNIALGLSNQFLRGGLRVSSLVSAGMHRPSANALAKQTRKVARSWGGYHFQRTSGFQLQSVNNGTAVFGARITFLSKSSSALISATMTMTFRTTDGWEHFHLVSISLTTG